MRRGAQPCVPTTVMFQKGRQCFAEGLSPTIASAIADLPLLTDENVTVYFVSLFYR
jgi:hypothetical protein